MALFCKIFVNCSKKILTGAFRRRAIIQPIFATVRTESMDKIENISNYAEKTMGTASPTQTWRGCSLEEIHRHLNEFELDHVDPVEPSNEHTVLYRFPIRVAENEPPPPLKAHPKWDAFHVRLPCSSKSQYPVTAEDGTQRIESRWDMIEQALLRRITNSHELQAAILAYNTKYENQWNFRALHRLFESELDESESRVFFEDLLPRIIRLALRLPDLIQAPIPLLKQGRNHSITLTQQQISCLLANAFLCTFPRRNTMKRKSEYSTFPDINFIRLFQSSGNAVLEKIKCICHYFRRVCPTDRDSSNVPTGVVTFTRRHIKQEDLPCWKKSNVPLSAALLHITSDGTIEDQGLGLLQVDFANKFLGGGVLGSGCVQEEIRFVICPELLASKLFTEYLEPTEALFIVGCERYSNYSGYAKTFKWDGDHVDETPRDNSRRKLTHIVAIDARRFEQPNHQYREECMLRELNKAYAGFLHELITPAPGIASGNWGCGAFGGEAKLKALLQLMVCAEAKRPLAYFTFGDNQLRDEVIQMYNILVEKNVRVKDLWTILSNFEDHTANVTNLYKYIRSQIEHSLAPLNLLRSDVDHFAQAKSCEISANKCRETHDQNLIKAHKQQSPICTNNLSQDIFACSSDSEDEGVVAKCISSLDVNNKIVEDDQNCVAAIKVKPNQFSESQLDTASSQAPRKSKSEPRQRTLLEMLDTAYMKGADPASKRHCSSTK